MGIRKTRNTNKENNKNKKNYPNTTSNDSKKINGSSSNNIINNINNNNENNSLFHSIGNCRNVLAFPASIKNISKGNSIQTKYIRFNGLNSSNDLSFSNNMCMNSINELSCFNARNKKNKKFKDKINNIENVEKEIFSLKNQNNSNNIKVSSLFKTKYNVKSKSINDIYFNSTYYNNSNKKSYKSSFTNNSINLNSNMKQNESNGNYKDIYETNYINLNLNKKLFDLKFKSTNSFSNLNSQDFLSETVQRIPIREKIINNLNDNLLVVNNKKNKKQVRNIFNSLNNIKSYNSLSNNGEDNINENISNINNIGFQTYNIPFRKNVIKVNIIEKDNNQIKNNKEKTKTLDKESDSISSKTIKSVIFMNKNKYGNKIPSNLKTNINDNSKKKEKKVLFIDNEIKIKKNKKKLIYDNNEKDEIEKIREEIIKNNEKQKELSAFLNKKNNIICLKSNMGINSNRVINTLNFNIFPFNRSENKTYMKKKYSNINISNNIFNGNINYSNSTNRSSVLKHKKSNSISLNYYDIQRNDKEKINLKNNNYKNNHLFSPNKKKIGKFPKNKSIVVPEYRIKLNNIKSRVADLLNIYSLLAIRSINITNESLGNKI